MRAWKAVAATIAALVAFSVGWSGPVSPVCADEAADRDRARSLLVAGDRHIERGDRFQRRGRHRQAEARYEQALQNYLEAYDLVPKPTLFFAIAGAEEKLGRHLGAVEHYQRVLAEVDDETLRARAQNAIDNLARHLGKLVLEVEPEGAEISVDSKLRGQAPLPRPVYLEPGVHTVTVTASGYTAAEVPIRVEAGKTEQQTISLAEVPVVVKSPRPMEPEDIPVREAAPPPEPPSKTGVVVGASLTVALLAGAGVTGGLAWQIDHELGEGTVEVGEVEDQKSMGKTLALVSDGLTIGAALVGVYTIYRYAFVYRPERAAYEREQRSAAHPSRTSDTAVAGRQWWLAPYVSGHSGGLAVGGRF